MSAPIVTLLRAHVHYDPMTDAVLVPLKSNHKIFADHYLRTGNASESARKAGSTAKACHVTGHKWLRRPDVQQYLATAAAKLAAPRAEAAEQAKDLKARVIQELSTMAFANIAEFITVGDDGLPRVDFSGASEEQLRAITSIKTKKTKRLDKDGNVVAEDFEAGFTLADKYRGLELLGRTQGIFRDAEQRVVVDVADRLLTARGRLAQAGYGVTPRLSDRGGGGEGV
jgi:hypothetical protein